MARSYNNLPHPTKEPEAFNQYLRDNNEVVQENAFWIVIRNSYLKHQLVAFCKFPVGKAADINDVIKAPLLSRYQAFLWIFTEYDDHHIYVNKLKDRSVPDRFHVHIKLENPNTHQVKPLYAHQ